MILSYIKENNADILDIIIPFSVLSPPPAAGGKTQISLFLFQHHPIDGESVIYTHHKSHQIVSLYVFPRHIYPIHNVSLSGALRCENLSAIKTYRISGNERPIRYIFMPLYNLSGHGYLEES